MQVHDRAQKESERRSNSGTDEETHDPSADAALVEPDHPADEADPDSTTRQRQESHPSQGRGLGRRLVPRTGYRCLQKQTYVKVRFVRGRTPGFGDRRSPQG